MKKLSKWLYALAFTMILPLSLVSCGDPNNGGEENPPEDKTIAVDLLAAGYFGDDVGNGTATYLLVFGSDEVYMSTNGIKGTGEYISLQIFSEETGTMFPALGEYKSGTNYAANTILPGSLVNLDGRESIVGSYVYIYENDQLVDYKFIKAATMTLSGNASNAKVVFNVMFEDGTKADYSFSGAMPVDNYVVDPYEFESNEVTTINRTAQTAGVQAIDYADYGFRVLYVEMLDGNFSTNLMLFADLDGDVNGTYDINDSEAVGSCLASSGLEGDQIYPSFCGLLDAEGYVTDAWFLIEGTVTLTDESIVLNAVSAKGSTINVTYNGAWTITEPQQTIRKVRMPHAPLFVPVK